MNDPRIHPPVTIGHLAAQQIPEAAAMLARAFRHDPLATHVLRDASTWDARSYALMDYFCRTACITGEAWATLGTVEGVALWAPPVMGGTSVVPAETPGFDAVAAVWDLAEVDRLMVVLDYLGTLHGQVMPTAHWYLSGMGVEPTSQGRGIGSQLLQPVLARADSAGLPCYLETQTARNVSFYHKHGFTVHSETDAPDGPHFWLMVRQPQHIE